MWLRKYIIFAIPDQNTLLGIEFHRNIQNACFIMLCGENDKSELWQKKYEFFFFNCYFHGPADWYLVNIIYSLILYSGFVYELLWQFRVLIADFAYRSCFMRENDDARLNWRHFSTPLHFLLGLWFKSLKRNQWERIR